MRNRTRCIWTAALFCAFASLIFARAESTRDAKPRDNVVERSDLRPSGDTTDQGTPAEPAASPVGDAAADETIPVGKVYGVAPGAVFRPFVPGVGVVEGAAAAAVNTTVVYSNKLGSGVFAPGGPGGLLIADDIATTAGNGCILDGFTFRVSGDPVGDGSGVGPFDVNYALYTGCPGAGGFPIFGTTGTANLPDNGAFEIVFTVDPALDIPLEQNLYFGLNFSRSLAGIVVGAPATLGFSEDRFHFSGGSACNSGLGGFPAFDHASFDLEITVRNDCPGGVCEGTCAGGDNPGSPCTVDDDCTGGLCTAHVCNGGANVGQPCTFDCSPAFPIYKDSKQSGTHFSAAPGSEFFADDLVLEVPVDVLNPCNLIAWEVGFKGQGIAGGAVQASLHTFLDNADPGNGGIIPGTRLSTFVSPFFPLTVVKKTFDTPIPITQQDLRVVFRVTSSFVGPIRTCKQAGPGSTQDIIFIFNESSGLWEPADLGDSCHSAFEVSLTCAGEPPRGACCDMKLTNDRICFGGFLDGQPCTRTSQCRVCEGGTNDGTPCQSNLDCTGGGTCPGDREVKCIGDAVCRNLPQMNCAFPLLWEEGGSCGAVCDGGFSAGESCLTSADCQTACVGGGDDGQACVNDTDCRGACEQGPFQGNACSTNQDCIVGLCGPPGTCTDTGKCVGSLCSGGPNHGQACSRAADCPGGECGSSCAGGDNDGLPCLSGGDCPGGICPATTFSFPCGKAICCTSNDKTCCVTEKECNTPGAQCGSGAGDVVELPVLYTPTQTCGQTACPQGACIARQGECTEARDGICGPACDGGSNNNNPCVDDLDCPGGTCITPATLNGAACSIPRPPCILGANPRDECCLEGGFCRGQPGCEEPFCCDDVCDVILSCCTEHWGPSCAAQAFVSCARTPANDECFNPLPAKGAELLPIPGSAEGDGAAATISGSDPGFCCKENDPGGPGVGTLWYRVEGPATGLLSVDTCLTAGGGGADSILQVFELSDPDRGICEDLSVCSIAAQDCFDTSSACVLDEETACQSLIPISCSDDAIDAGLSCTNGTTPFPDNSRLCVEVVPGDPYYIMVGPRTAAEADKYKVTVNDSCVINPDPIPNDLCTGALDFFAANEKITFDLAGFGGFFAPATFDCPGPDPFSCSANLKNDIWYDWTAPETGFATFQTCDNNDPPATAPDTSMVVYDGCDCPVELGTELGCSDNCGFGPCSAGSCVTADVVGGNCYKVRLGGNQGGLPGGTLSIDLFACPAGPATAIDPLDGTVDARQPQPPDVPPTPGTALQGVKTFLISWPSGTSLESCYNYCETPIDGFFPNSILSITDNGDDTFTVQLVRAIAPGAVGVLTVLHGDGSKSTVTVTAHAGNVDATGPTDLTDLDALITAVDGGVPFNVYSHDINQDGAISPHDILRWLDGANAVGEFPASWLDVSLPVCGVCCPVR